MLQAYSNAMWAVAAVWSPEEVPYLDPCIRDLALLCSVEIAKGLTHQGFMVQNLVRMLGMLLLALRVVIICGFGTFAL